MARMRIFVSHSSSDKAACDVLVSALRRAGADVWYDEHNLGTGQLLDEIQRELIARPVFIVLLSPSALTSKWVQHECKWAFILADQDPSRILLPVVVSPIDPNELNTTMLFLSGFKRVEGPGNKPYPQVEAIKRTLHLLELTPAGALPAPAAPQPAETVNDLLAKGRALLAQKKYAEAIPFFERVTQQDPSSFPAWANLGRIDVETTRWQDSLNASDRALAINDKQAWVWYNKSLALAHLNRHQEALAAYERALALDPTLAVARTRKRIDGNDLRRYGGALSLDPNSPFAWTGKIATLNDFKRADTALATYEQALTLDPNSAVAWTGKGCALQSLGCADKALAAFERALALDPTLADAWSNKGTALYDLKRYGEALSSYGRVLSLDPDSAVVWNNRGVTLYRLGRTDEALVALRRALSLDPDSAVVGNNNRVALNDFKRTDAVPAAPRA